MLDCRKNAFPEANNFKDGFRLIKTFFVSGFERSCQWNDMKYAYVMPSIYAHAPKDINIFFRI